MSPVQLSTAVYARAEELNFKRPRNCSFGHRGNVARHIANGTIGHEVYFALMDDRVGERIKRMAMTHQRAAQNNRGLKGSGYSWHRVEK